MTNSSNNTKLSKPTWPGKFVTFMIALLIFGDLQIPYFLANPDALHSIYGNLPSWYPVYAILGLASNVAIVIGMWKMKKWAAYILIAYFLSKIPTELFVFNPRTLLAIASTTIVGAILWFWAVKRMWKYFD